MKRQRVTSQKVRAERSSGTRHGGWGISANLISCVYYLNIEYRGSFNLFRFHAGAPSPIVPTLQSPTLGPTLLRGTVYLVMQSAVCVPTEDRGNEKELMKTNN